MADRSTAGTLPVPAPLFPQDAGTVRHLHTLGPSGTNLEAAARAWLSRRGVEGSVWLHETLEAALEVVPADGEHGLVACAVYPHLHELVFRNLRRMRIIDSFVMPTWNMVLASADGRQPRTVASHPAPASLVPPGVTVMTSTSNARAAADCATGLVEGCVTTSAAAAAYGLKVISDFGPVPMAFTVHRVDAHE